jgi:SpoVK/Ycf46/Vps4 family AAA+-type ATPase
LFDEADSMFGKRTDVKEANDRFANAQTNYLLQRIETFEGIALLTSNSQARFDAAFTRRIDVVLEFASPGPQERCALWESHLGSGHSLSVRQIHQLAALVDVEGGQIRNAVLAAAVFARWATRPIEHADVVRGLASELKKVGKTLPHQLKTA